MVTTDLNPPWLAADDYVEFLNTGFCGQWNRRTFRWYLRGCFNGRATDIAVRAEGRRIVAGVGFCYRQVMDQFGRLIDVCIMSAGTTRADERGRGHYHALLEVAMALCRRHDCRALLGFVTRGNASGRGLERLGAHAIPSYYLIADRATPERATRLVPARGSTSAADLSRLQRLGEVSAGGAVHFHYGATADWIRQFIERPNGVRGVRLAHDCTALIEAVGDTDRLQWLACPPEKRVASIAALAHASTAARRKFFMYTLDPLLARSAGRLGLKTVPGYLMLLPIVRAPDIEALATAAWHLQGGDRM